MSLAALTESVAKRSNLTASSVRYGAGAFNADARRVVFWLAVQRGCSVNEIAQWFGVDHSVVRAGLARFESLMAALVAEGA